jgi:hypothetical protein
MAPLPRSREQRHRDALDRLEHDTDAWVSTADPATGTPYLIPLSFLWDGRTLLISTPATSPTGRNLCATGRVRLAVGPTRDVVLIEGTARPLTGPELPAEIADAFAARTGFEPRDLGGRYLYFRIRPDRIQAWREENELTGRELMRGGEWLVDGAPEQARGG